VKGIPYHRIVYSDGRIWVTESCRKKRLALYKEEGIRIDAKDRIIGFADVRLEY
jgi:alkylated DNA nucleotide flippase Atl1